VDLVEDEMMDVGEVFSEAPSRYVHVVVEDPGEFARVINGSHFNLLVFHLLASRLPPCTHLSSIANCRLRVSPPAVHLKCPSQELRELVVVDLHHRSRLYLPPLPNYKKASVLFTMEDMQPIFLEIH
jgi:hypothetical protein